MEIAQHRATLLGLEHEFVVTGADGVVGFPSLIHGLGLGQRNLDPADPNAYRLGSGAAITCDGAEAEIALPPARIAPGFAFEVAHRAAVERRSLAARLPVGHRLEGYSTHLSVSVADELARAVCLTYAKTFSPALILLMDRADSPGLLIRPRPGRIELGAEYAAGDQLVAASVFAVATVMTCLGTLRYGSAENMPLEIDVRIDPSVQRFGWYVDRKAFGVDLLADGRSARLRTVRGESLTAREQLERSWEVARPKAETFASAEEISAVDDSVSGQRPLPSERVLEGPITWSGGTRLAEGEVYGNVLAVRERPGFGIAPVMLTWELAVFLIVDTTIGRRAFAAVPRTHLEQFLGDVDRGALDRPIETFVRRRIRARRTLRSWRDVEGVGFYDRIGPRLGLLRPEYRFDGSLDDPRLGRAPRIADVPGWSAARRTLLQPAVSAARRARTGLVGVLPGAARMAKRA